jgi:dipeptidyl aminopeptidase/acylaminoacyl peptidase
MRRTLSLVKASARHALIAVASLSLLPGPSAALPGETPLAIDDVLSETSFEHEGVPLGVSRDGQLLAYTATRAATSAGLWIVDLQTHTRTNVSEGLRSVSSPTWSPDGQLLAFLVTDTEEPAVINHYEVWVWNRSDSTRRRLTAAIARPFFPGSFVWTADSRYLITNIAQSGPTVEAPNDRKTSTRKNPVGVTVHEQSVNLPRALVPVVKDRTPSPTTRHPLELFDIGRIDVRTGELERIAKGVWARAYATAPTGSAIAVVTRDTPNSDDLDLWITDPASGQLHKAISHVAIGSAALSWSPNGQLLAVHSTNQSWIEQPRPDAGVCDVIELLTGKQTRFHVGTYDSRNMNIPLWTDESDAVVLVENGRIVRHTITFPQATETISVPGSAVESLLRNQLSGRLSDAMVRNRLVTIVTDSNGTSMRVVTIDPATKAVSPLRNDGWFYAADAAALVPERNSVVLGVEGPAMPFDFFLFDVTTGQRERLTHLNPQYDGYVFGQARRIPYRNATGEDRTGILLLPADYRPGTRFPTIVFERDRASAHFARHFGLWGGSYNMQLYATRGYAILYPDIVVTRTPHERVTSDVLPAIDAAIETGVVDPDRLALYGHSLGGYHAMMLLVQTTRFKAAIVSEGYYNLFTLHTRQMNYTESFVPGTLGPPWQYSDRYVANSPYMLLDKLTTPILLVGGSRDAYVEQGDELFSALQHANKATQYIRYEGEAHNANSWSLSNRRNYVARTLAWLDYWLRPRN